MTVPNPDLVLVRDRQQRYEQEAAGWRLARRRPDRERTPGRAAAVPSPIGSTSAGRQRVQPPTSDAA